ncbi:MAG: DUF4215 domain-containing protein [Deltaproteobacteria bacterium]|nr:DUF4215 domain-containing protein [Deltaproteobacteria bacterium]
MTTTAATGRSLRCSVLALIALAGAACSPKAVENGDLQPPTTEVCGNGDLDVGEECDDGNYYQGDACLNDCTKASCGDGQVFKGVEACDDGNNKDGDGCSADCRYAEGCGNGKLDANEECDDGNASNADACVEGCKKAKCGDGYAQIGVEECDDGNKVDQDGCSNECKKGAESYSCPGLSLPLKPGEHVSMVGDSAKSKDNQAGSCGGKGSPEIPYELLPSIDGWLVVTLTGIGGFDPALYLRADDCNKGAEVGCVDSTSSDQNEMLLLQVKGGKSYFAFADGHQGSKGQYSLDLDLSKDVPGDTCPGVALVVPPSKTVSVSGDTSFGSSDSKGVDKCAASASTKDLVYQVTPTADGTLTATLDPSYNAIMYVRVGSCSGGKQVACSEDSPGGSLKEVSFSVSANTKYSVFADGENGSAGAFTLELYLSP